MLDDSKVSGGHRHRKPFTASALILLAVFLVYTAVGIFLFFSTGDGASAAVYGNTLSVPGQYGSIQAAINASHNGDTVLVANGTYSENINFTGKNITVKSVNGASVTKIQGTGANNPVVTIATGETSSAVLQGFTIDNQSGTNTQSRGISISGSAAPTIRNCVVEGNSVTSSYVDGAGIYINGGTASIEGTTVGNSGKGNTSRSGAGIYGTSLSAPLALSGSTVGYNSATSGAGIYMSNAGQLTTINDTTFSHNSSSQNGGAIYGNGSPITLNGTTLSNNSSNQDGAGICMYGGNATLSVYGSHINGNAGRNGGGIYGWSSPTMTVNDSTVDSNTASLSGGGLYLNATTGTAVFNHTSLSGNSVSSNHGGGVYSNSALSLVDCTLNGNSSTLDGGGVYLMGAAAATSISGGTVDNNHGRYGVGIYQGASASLTVYGADISGNESPSSGIGGGIYAAGATLNVDKTYIRGNRTGMRGGGIYNTGTTINVTNSMITGNVADQQSYSDGGGIYQLGGSFTLNGSTVAGNYALYYGGGVRSNSGSFTTTDSIIWGNYAGTANPQTYGSLTVSYSDVQGGYGGDHNINANPQFVDFQQATGGNPVAGGDFHIGSAQSAVIDAASSQYNLTQDIDSDARPHGAGIDMGADEMAPSCQGTKPPLSLSLKGATWSSYCNYVSHILSVTYTVTNSGNDANAARVVGSTASSSVSFLTPTPVTLGNITMGAPRDLTLDYYVPTGVSSFQATVYVTAQDSCGYSYEYPRHYTP